MSLLVIFKYELIWKSIITVTTLQEKRKRLEELNCCFGETEIPIILYLFQSHFGPECWRLTEVQLCITGRSEKPSLATQGKHSPPMGD